MLSGQLNYEGQISSVSISDSGEEKLEKLHSFSKSLILFFLLVTKSETDLLSNWLLSCYKTLYFCFYFLLLLSATDTLLFVSIVLYPSVTFKMLSIAQTSLEETNKDINWESVVITCIVSSLVASLIYRLVVIILLYSKYPLW